MSEFVDNHVDVKATETGAIVASHSNIDSSGLIHAGLGGTLDYAHTLRALEVFCSDTVAIGQLEGRLSSSESAVADGLTALVYDESVVVVVTTEDGELVRNSDRAMSKENVSAHVLYSKLETTVTHFESQWDAGVVELPSKYGTISVFAANSYTTGDHAIVDLKLNASIEQPDGHVRLTSIHWSALWNLANSSWILGNTTNANSPNTLFWPVKINGNTIALRAADGKFCQRRVTYNLANGSIGTEVSSLTKQAELQVEELVAKSLVHNVRYQIEYGRVFDETSYTGWSSTLVNSQDVEVTISLSFTYEDTKDYTVARSYTLETGVPTLFDSALPFVSKGGSIDDAAAKISALLQWNAANTMTATVTGKGSVTLPAKTSAVVSYVGKRGTCNVPFYYTQADTVVNAPIGSLPVEVMSEGIDGLYTATNTYDFNLVIEKTQAI
ncbi:hypothetical protein AAHA92_19422 [Salvia divinorum]|uniref:Uncharacterized protein n=1 Tax=Salvia divinorum TaxID=28513 RepID=A0ABD1H5B9_SALDI